MNYRLLFPLVMITLLLVGACKKEESTISKNLPSSEEPGLSSSGIFQFPSPETLAKIGPENNLDIRWAVQDPIFIVSGKPKKFFTSPIGQGNQDYFSALLAQFLAIPLNYTKIERFTQFFATPDAVPIQREIDGKMVVQQALISRRTTVMNLDSAVTPAELVGPIAAQQGVEVDALKKEKNGITYYELFGEKSGTPQMAVLFFLDEKNIVFCEGNARDVAFVLAGTPQKNAAIDRIKHMDIDNNDLVFVVSREGMNLPSSELEQLCASLGLQQNIAAALAKHFRSIMVRANLSAEISTSMLSALYDASNDEGAKEVAELIQGLLILGETSLATMDENMQKMLPIPPEFALAALGAMSVETTKNQVEFSLKKFEGFDETLATGIKNQKEMTRQMQIAEARQEQIMVAAQANFAYYQAHNKFPQDICAPDGTPLLSWRVELLPRLGLQELYDKFKLDEPWDSEANRALLSSIPNLFIPLAYQTEPGQTLIRRFNSPDTPFARPDLKIEDLKQPQSTLMLVSVQPSEAVAWTQPDSLAWEPEKIEQICGPFLLGVMFTGQVVQVPLKTKTEEETQRRNLSLDAAIKGIPQPVPE